MRTVGTRSQRTLAGAATVEGPGLITGRPVRLRFLPAPAHFGLCFRRTDLPGTPEIPALADQVCSTERRTTLGSDAAQVMLVEHVLAALAGLRVDNCIIELDGPEPPGLDGSARGFVDAIFEARIVAQSARRPIRTPSRTLTLTADGATLSIHPADAPSLSLSYLLDYGIGGRVPRQNFTVELRPELFLNEVADCRTFLTEAEALAMRSQGVGAHLSASEVVVFGSRSVPATPLRYANEPARHKVLDLIGDLALCGFDLAGHVVGYRSGHALNVELARRLLKASQSANGGPTPRSSVVRRAA